MSAAVPSGRAAEPLPPSPATSSAESRGRPARKAFPRFWIKPPYLSARGRCTHLIWALPSTHYGYRTNTPTLKKMAVRDEHLSEFVNCYNPQNRPKRKAT